MKKFAVGLLTLFISCFLLSCRAGAGLEDLEAHNDFNHLLAQADEDEGQFIFISSMSSLKWSRIMYLDPASMEAVPLCGKPECLHSSESGCNADLQQLGDVIGMAVDADTILLCVAGGDDEGVYEVYRMKTDGTGRRKVRTLAPSDPAKNPDFPRSNRRVIFHRGKVYATGQKSVLSDGEWRFYDIIISYDLSSKSEGRIIYEKLNDNTRSHNFEVRAVGESLFYVRSEHFPVDEQMQADIEIGKINIETEEHQLIHSGKADFGPYEFYTDGSRFVFTTVTDGRVMEYDDNKKGMRELTNFSTENETYMTMYLAEDRIVGFAFPGENMIHIKVGDFNGKMVYDVLRESQDVERGGRVFCGIDEQYMYCDYNSEDAEGVIKESMVVYSLDSEDMYRVWAEE